LFPEVEIGHQLLYQHEHLLAGINYALFKSAAQYSDLSDAALIAALTSAARIYQTLSQSGIYYEEPTTDPAQQAIAAEIQNTVKHYRAAEVEQARYSALRDSDVFHALVFLVRIAHSRTSGRSKSRAFLDFLHEQFAEKPSSFVPDNAGSKLIVP
jgi:hypothetical protein